METKADPEATLPTGESPSAGVQLPVPTTGVSSSDAAQLATSSLPAKKQRRLVDPPDPDVEVIALSPKTLMGANRYVCDVCCKGFQRDQNLQLHRRGHNLPWKLKEKNQLQPQRRRVYLCPEPTCVHHDPAGALGDLMGIKKHFRRKHGEKKWKCDKCAKRYAVQSDLTAHSKICGTREYRCDCGTLFSRRDSFICHRTFCDALAKESLRAVSPDIQDRVGGGVGLPERDLLANGGGVQVQLQLLRINNYQDSICLDLEKALADETVAPIHLSFWLLKAITQDFSDDQQIGSGGFGSVYKGTLPNGKVVAVKKLHNNFVVQEENFLREADCFLKVKHKNIVRFLGYSYETERVLKQYQGRSVWADETHLLFCFEFLSNGSLANYLAGASYGPQWWAVHYRLIKGICEGVNYLHQQGIIHIDLKPDNILLDDNMMPKIADFGISRCFTENQSRIITENKVGTFGYTAPKFLESGVITSKTDIYSIGVIIIEILMGRKEKCPTVDKVLESWTNAIGTSKSSPLLEQVKLCAEIGTSCMHDDPSRRPDIQDIIYRLDEMDISE